MRSAAFALFALFTATSATPAQPPVASKTPPATLPADPAKLDPHLAAWEKASGKLTNFHVEVALTRKDAVRGKELEFKGSAIGMTPTFARLRLVPAGDAKGYEAVICNGKAVYHYDGQSNTVTEHKLPDPKADPAGATDNLILDFLFGMKAKALKGRFEVRHIGEDADYVYLEIKPVQAKDKQEFQQLRMALNGPKSKTPYLPAQIISLKPNGDAENWKFTKPQIDIPKITAEDFRYVEVKGFTLQQAPQRPATPAPIPVRPR
jgi:TIGR03009 family protein